MLSNSNDGIYQFNLETLTISHADFVIRDSNGNLVNTTGNGSTLEGTLSQGTYYRCLLEMNHTGTYSLSAHNLGPVDDFAENINTSGSLLIGQSTSGELGTSGDHDWFAIEIQNDGIYQFNLETLTISHADFVIRDSNGNLVNTTGNGSTLEGTLSQGTYYVDVYCEMNHIGTYSLNAQFIGPTDDYSADINTQGL